MKLHTKNERLRKIPSVDETLREPDIRELVPRYGRAAVVKAVKLLLEDIRKKILTEDGGLHSEVTVPLDIQPAQVEEKITAIARPSLQRVINATGIIIHTNLGRAPLSEEAINHIVTAARYYSNLEFVLADARRGARADHVEGLLQELTGAEAGFVVNNNAAAVLLCLNTLARGKEVLISRGELIEIGGSFRIPDIMQQSGAILVEVGTTNRTHLADYEKAITRQTALIMQAHTSNYRIVGFTAEVNLPELLRLGSRNSIPVMYDMGSGNLINPALLGLRDEPTVQEAVKSGVELITFSGDKLLGGPQAGIIVGKRHYIRMLKNNPLARALRIDKLTLAALEATLKAYVLQPEKIDAVPVMRMLTVAEQTLKKRARKIARAVKRRLPSLTIAAESDTSQIGGGAFPLHDLPTWVVAINPAPSSSNDFEHRLRAGTPPVIARISKDRVLLDMRTISPVEDRLVVQCILAAVEQHQVEHTNAQ